MALVRFSTDTFDTRYGVVGDDTVIDVTSLLGDDYPDSPFEQLSSLVATARENAESLASHDMAAVTLHQPVTPSKVIRLEGCYEHDLTDSGFDRFVEEDGLHEGGWPAQFAAPTTALVGPDEPVEIPQVAEHVRPGVELGFVIGREAKYLEPADAIDAVSGLLTVATLTMFDELPGLFGYKSFDSALPVASQVVPTDIASVDNLIFSVSVDGTELDSRSTDSWRFEPGEIVASVSEVMLLQPGDIILTGNPARVDHQLTAGEHLEVTVEGVGTVSTPIDREQTEAGIRI